MCRGKSLILASTSTRNTLPVSLLMVGWLNPYIICSDQVYICLLLSHYQMSSACAGCKHCWQRGLSGTRDTLRKGGEIREHHEAHWSFGEVLLCQLQLYLTMFFLFFLFILLPVPMNYMFSHNIRSKVHLTDQIPCAGLGACCRGTRMGRWDHIKA